MLFGFYYGYIVLENNSFYVAICFLSIQIFFFVNLSSNFFTIKITDNVLDRKTTWDQFRTQPFAKMFLCFIFRYFYISSNFKSRIFFIISHTKINISARTYTDRPLFDCVMVCIIVFFITAYLSMSIFFHVEVIYL